MSKKKKAATDNGAPATGQPTVGYGKPPKDSQFQKGKSGNPTGRRKGSKSFASVLQDTFNQPVSVTMNGKTEKAPSINALALKMIAMALSGNPTFMKMAFGYYAAANPAVNGDQSITSGSSFELTPEEWAAVKKSKLLKGLK